MTTAKSEGEGTPQSEALDVPTAPSFEDAIALTQQLLDQMEAAPDASWEQPVADLVATESGARGFFVTYLTDERSLADEPSESVLAALCASPDIVTDLLVKNLAMSTAMAITHRRNDQETMAQGSERVRSRVAQLLRQLTIPQIAPKLADLHQAATSGEGDYAPFLHRWKYDVEQKKAIADVIVQLCY